MLLRKTLETHYEAMYNLPQFKVAHLKSSNIIIQVPGVICTLPAIAKYQAYAQNVDVQYI